VLQSYAWPGNVRELQNVVNKIWMSAAAPTIEAEQVQKELANAAASSNEVLTDSVQGADPETHDQQAIRRALEQTSGHRGKAATFLGISRRTLSRKLRQFGFPSPRISSTPMGGLSPDQERSFRADLRIPLSLETAEGEELQCTAVNLSMNGLGLEGLSEAPGRQSLFRVYFQLPESDLRVDAMARVAWANAQGRAGICFTKLSPAGRNEVRRWLYQKIAEEGWTVQPEDFGSTPLEAASSLPATLTR
jgi:hypothetical protein